jgi:hypothetical protein
MINFTCDRPIQKIEGDLVPTMYVRQFASAPVTVGAGDWKIYVAPATDDVPASFAEGMREIQGGHAIDFDSAIGEPPLSE